MELSDDIDKGADIICAGGLVAYPTEAVYGLGCDPQNKAAVLRLLALKERPIDKGLILIAADLEQISRYLQPLSDEVRERVFATWPGPVTWLLPAGPYTPAWIRGEHDTVAVRVTAHATAAALCRTFGGAIVSTSANLSGQEPARTAAETQALFDQWLDCILVGEVGGADKPSEIRDAISGRIIRPGN